MSGKINLYAPFAGVKDGLTLCTLLLDEKKLKEVTAVIQELDARIAEINEAIETYGKASEMDTLLRVAGQKNQEAKQTLAAARSQAEETLAQAQATIDSKRKALDGQAAAVVAREEHMTEAEAAFKTEAERQQADMTDREAKAAKREDKATADLAEAKETKARYERLIADIQKRAKAA